jgi:hypothetical protein
MAKKVQSRAALRGIAGGIAVLIAAAILCGGVCSCQKQRLAAKERQLRELQEVFVPMRFRLVERTDTSLTVEIRFYSLFIDNFEDVDMEVLAQGKEVAPPQTITLSGEELFIDSVKIPNETRLPFAPEAVWVFPYRVFSDLIAPDDALPIYQWYDDAGFPAIYASLELEAADRKTLSDVYAGITDADTGNALHDMRKAARFRLGAWYDLAVHIKKGSLEFIAE